VGTQEHKLLQMTNAELGFKNFNAFLHNYRIREAQAALTDPHDVGSVRRLLRSAGFAEARVVERVKGSAVLYLVVALLVSDTMRP
jgi:hypothetical protein